MYDHLNSGILNGGRDGPGLNIGRLEDDFVRFCLWSAEEKKLRTLALRVNKTVEFGKIALQKCKSKVLVGCENYRNDYFQLVYLC